MLFRVKIEWLLRKKDMLINNAFTAIHAGFVHPCHFIFILKKIPQPEDKSGLTFPLGLIINKRELL